MKLTLSNDEICINIRIYPLSSMRGPRMAFPKLYCNEETDLIIKT